MKWFFVAAFVWVPLGCGGQCECPVASAGVTLIADGADGKELSGVSVIFSGPASGSMTCEPGGTHGGVICSWPHGTPEAGDYSIQVSATGYERNDFHATMTVTVPPPTCKGCCCTHASLDETRVTLTPAH